MSITRILHVLSLDSRLCEDVNGQPSNDCGYEPSEDEHLDPIKQDQRSVAEREQIAQRS